MRAYCVKISDEVSPHSSERDNLHQSPAALDDHRGGKLRLAHYKGSLVIVKPFRGDIAPIVTQLDKVEMTAVRNTHDI